jgi:leucine dehydrogenase
MSAVAKPATNGTRGTRASASVEKAIGPVPLEHEELVVRRGGRSGLYMAVAIHSTALGPALGGVRIWHYAEPIEAIRDSLRLARGMTYKAAVAGLDLGGGKGVICAPPVPPSPAERRAALLDFGDLVDSLDGRYITAEDVGVTPGDISVIAECTEHVTGLEANRGGSGDPSPFTALGIEAAMRACARERFGSGDLDGVKIAIAGLGHVGAALARRLADAGAVLVVSDLDDAKRAVADSLGARWVEPEHELLVECDILAPCALGGAIDRDVAALLRCAVICGCANNQLAEDGLADDLARHGILYAPDYVVNAGGLIHVYREIRGYSEQEAIELVLGIEATLDRVLDLAGERDLTPLAASQLLAEGRLEGALVRN